MNDHPILMTSDMVRAVLDGRKTQTRRIIKPQPEKDPDGTKYNKSGYWCAIPGIGMMVPLGSLNCLCPYGEVGDTLWVRETWATLKYWDNTKPSKIDQFRNPKIWYIADEPTPSETKCNPWNGGNIGKVRPSIFMPKWACRIFLEITNIRVERVQEITPKDCIAEGITLISGKRNLSPASAYKDYSGQVEKCGAVASFCTLWDSINIKRAPWKDNPWVFVISFKKINKP